MPTILLILSLAVSTLVTATSVDRFHGLYQQVQVERVVTEVARAAERRRPGCPDSSTSETSIADLVAGDWLESRYLALAEDLFGADSLELHGDANQKQLAIHTPGKNLGWLAVRTRGELDSESNSVEISTRRQASTPTSITPGLDYARLLTMGRGTSCSRY